MRQFKCTGLIIREKQGLMEELTKEVLTDKEAMQLILGRLGVSMALLQLSLSVVKMCLFQWQGTTTKSSLSRR